MRCQLLLLFFIGSYGYSFAQNSISITGMVNNSKQEILSSAIVTVKNAFSNRYSITDTDGLFIIKINASSENPTETFMSIKLIGFAVYDTSFKVLSRNIDLGVIYLKEEYTTLNSVLVKLPPVVVNGDTTTLNVKSFSNKLDNSLEDVLRKMPGFELSSSGDISFNGKRIENILIDGDELTKNYKQISKNIGPEMLDKVQMIDKYNGNSALKGLANSGNQMMNLKLKNPKKLKAFGTAKAGVGMEDKQKMAANMFVLKNKYKALLIAAKNNIGETPYSEVTNNGDNALVKDYEFENSVLPEYIYQDRLFNRPAFFANNSTTLFNRSNLAVINNNFKINTKNEIKLFSDIYDDRIFQYKNSSVRNLVSPSLSYEEAIVKKFNPLYSNTFLQYNHYSQKNRLLVASNFASRRYREVQNIEAPINYTYSITNLLSRLSAGVFFTRRIDSLRAYEVLIQNNNGSNVQNASAIQNSTRKIDSLTSTLSQLQTLNNEDNHNKNVFKYIFKDKKGILNTLRVQNTNIFSTLQSSLKLTDSSGTNTFPNSLANNSILRNSEVSLNYNTSFRVRKFNISLDAGLFYFKQSINFKKENRIEYKNQFGFTPSINVAYKINEVAGLTANTGFTNELPDLAMQSSNPVLSSYRSLIKTINTSEKINSFKANVIYNYRNFKDGKSLLVSWFHLSRFKGIISDNNFQADFDYFQKSFVNRTQSLNNIIVNGDRYYDDIRLGFNIKNNLLFYGNPISSQGVVANRNYFSYTGSFTIRPSFSKDINGNAGVEYTYNKDLNSKAATNSINPFISGTASLSKSLTAGTKLNLYSNNIFERRNYFLGDLFFIYNFPKNKANLNLNFINVTNTKEIYSGYRTVFQERSSVSFNLPRYFLLEFKYRFN